MTQEVRTGRRQKKFSGYFARILGPRIPLDVTELIMPLWLTGRNPDLYVINIF